MSCCDEIFRQRYQVNYPEILPQLWEASPEASDKTSNENASICQFLLLNQMCIRFAPERKFIFHTKNNQLFQQSRIQLASCIECLLSCHFHITFVKAPNYQKKTEPRGVFCVWRKSDVYYYFLLNVTLIGMCTLIHCRHFVFLFF